MWHTTTLSAGRNGHLKSRKKGRLDGVKYISEENMENMENMEEDQYIGRG
jgi:hypothetical protein